MRPTPICLALVLTTASLPLMSQTEPTALVKAAEKAAPSLGAGGFVVAESTKGVVHYAVAGQPAPHAGIPPEKIIFEIGSISKVFTSVLLAQTVLAGKAALTDPISKYLPPDLKLDPKVAAITLEQLASHTSGLPRLPDNFHPANPRNPYVDFTEKELFEFLENFHPEAAPPQPVSYSNLGAGLLGHLLERIHGKSYAELLASGITGPLGMKDTVITLSAEQASRLARPYSGSVQVENWDGGVLTGAGGIRSTAEDLVTFTENLMSDKSPLHPAWELMRQPHATSGEDTVGLAVFFKAFGGTTFYTHSGGTGGYRSAIEFAPSENHTAVVLENNDVIEPINLIVAARGPKAPAAEDNRATVAIEPAALNEYVGDYPIDARMRFTAVIDADGRLRMRLTGQQFLAVAYLGNDRFIHKGVGAEWEFRRDAAGKIASVVLHQRGREIPAKRSNEPAPTVLFLRNDKLQEYTGKFQLAPGHVFDVTAHNGQLYAKLTGQQSLPVFCDRPDHFVYDVVDAALSFDRDDAGVVTKLVLHQNGLDQPAPRVTGTN